jgi:hypothetical protein
LALCDYRTVTPEVDAIENDIVYQQGVGENTLLFFNNSHQWYYLSDQQTDEMLVFRNAVSEDSKRPRKSFSYAMKMSDSAQEHGMHHSIILGRRRELQRLVKALRYG